jgi:hypothetical protein
MPLNERIADANRVCIPPSNVAVYHSTVSNGDNVQPARVAKPSFKVRLKALFREYGLIAILTHATISITVISGFSLAIWIGVSPSSATGMAGVIAAGWAAAQPILPLRTLLTLTLTPIIARVLRRRRRVAPEEAHLAAQTSTPQVPDAPPQ